MYEQIWTKYLPVIRILMKKSAAGDQQLALNIGDFERSGVARKSGYKFLIRFVGGRVDNVITESALARSLVETMQANPATRELLQQHNYEITMNTKFQIGIHYLAPAAADQPSTEN